ncbi:MAG: hypothetical protein H7A51_12995 [Akkermansiaceae bacterium]|nr:hypothetical protein [Akkermansiaceae bacterium]
MPPARIDMQTLFPTILLLTCLAFLQSCSPAKQYYQPLTKRPEKPWEGSSTSWGGFSERSLDKNRVQVSFETFNKPGHDFASYFVRVRAAEIALAQGHDTFLLTNLGTERWTETSHFPGYIVPGYWEYRDREVIHCTHHCKKGCREHIDIIREQIWIPDQFVPPHTSVNQLSKADVVVSQTGGGTRVNAARIIAEALSGNHGFGKPRLSPQTMKNYQAHLPAPSR